MRTIISAIGLLTSFATAAHAAAPAPAPAAPVAAPPASAAPPPPATSLVAAPAFDAPTPRGVSVWGILPWNGVGVGARMMLPLSIPGVVHSPSVRDNFALEFGADLLRWSYDFGVAGFGGGSYSWTEILASGGIMWNFWLSNQFAFYPKVELGYAFGWYSGLSYAGRPGYGGLFLSGDAGAIYNLGGKFSLRAEIGTSGVKAGVGWLF